MTQRSELMACIDAMRDTLVRDLIELVRIPTVNPPGDHYEQFCRVARDLARACNCEVDLVYVPEEEAERRYPWGKGHPRVSVLGRYRQSKRSHEGKHLSGHLDTVPAGRGWTKDPWKPVVEDGRLYGLGVSDMKGGIASIIGALGAFMTSSSTASNVLFGAVQSNVAHLHGMSRETIIGAQAAGSAYGNAIAPANVVLGTSIAGIKGQEGAVLRTTMPWTVVVAVLTGIATILLVIVAR